MIQVTIVSRLQNTLITVSAPNYPVWFWVTPASLGVKGIEGAEKAGETVGGELLKQNCLEVVVTLKGIGAGKLAALKGLKKSGVKILSLQDVTAIPFNGCRPPKKRRI